MGFPGEGFDDLPSGEAGEIQHKSVPFAALALNQPLPANSTLADSAVCRSSRDAVVCRVRCVGQSVSRSVRRCCRFARAHLPSRSRMCTSRSTRLTHRAAARLPRQPVGRGIIVASRLARRSRRRLSIESSSNWVSDTPDQRQLRHRRTCAAIAAGGAQSAPAVPRHGQALDLLDDLRNYYAKDADAAERPLRAPVERDDGMAAPPAGA